MAERRRRMCSALWTAALLLPFLVTLAGTGDSAGAATTCSGTRDAAKAIAAENAFIEVPDFKVVSPDGSSPAPAGAVGATIQLRYSEKYHCAWSLIAGQPGVTTWMDRWIDGHPTWDGPIGQRDIQGGNTTTYTVAVDVTGAQVRACGNGFYKTDSHKHPLPIVCTGWFHEGGAAPAPSVQEPTPSAPAPAPTGKPTQALARQILQLADEGKITISPIAAGEGVESDRADHSLPRLQLEDIAEGNPAHLSTRCPYASQYRQNPIEPDQQFLRFLIDLGNSTHYTITVLFGQCHPKSRETSYHHKGQAADFACGLDTATATAVGRKYGVSQFTGESCVRGPTFAAHWHYSVGGH